MSERKIVRRSVAIALGIICIVLIAGIVELWFAYLVEKDYRNDDDNKIAGLNDLLSNANNQISQLYSNITNLQNQVASQTSTINLLTSNLTNLQNQVTIQQKALNDLLNVTATVSYRGRYKT